MNLGSRFAQLRDKALAVLEARRDGNREREATAQQELEVLQTELEVQQDELVESQRRAEELAAHYRQLFFDSPTALVLLDPINSVRELNRRAETLLGMTSSRCLGVDFKQFVAAEDHEWWAGLLRRAEGESFNAELVLRRTGGAKRRCVVALARRPDGLLLMVDDITALRQAEDQRRSSDERLARLLQDSHEGVLFYDAQTFLVSQVNDALSRMLGLSVGELLGRSVVSLFPDDVAGVQELALKQATLAPRPGALELRFSRAGEPLLTEATLGRLIEGQTTFVTLLLRDVTGRRKLERERDQLLEERARSQKLEAIGQLSSGLAHNLNNVLAAVLGCASLPPEASREELLEAMAEIRNATLRGREITGQLTALARREPARAAPFDLAATLGEVVTLLRRTLPTNIKLEPNVPDGPLLFDGDRADWHQVFLNLSLNARDAMPSGGVLSFTGALEAEQLTLELRDTGLGMSREVLDRAFEPFFTTKGPSEGTGLGLSHLDAVARAHGVAVECESKPGHGTSFVLRFRGVRRGPAQEAASPPTAPPAEKLKARALLVDDDDMVRRSTKRVLTRLGLEVSAVASGREALLLLERDARFDVVLTDLTMPGMSGLDFARAVKAFKASLPVVLVTGNHQAPEHEVDAVLGKPFKPEELQAVLTRVTRR